MTLKQPPPILRAEWSTLRRLLQPKDAILLIEEAVFAGLRTSRFSEQCARQGCPLYALHLDVTARGLIGYYSPSIRLIQPIEWIGLVNAHKKHLSW